MTQAIYKLFHLNIWVTFTWRQRSNQLYRKVSDMDSGKNICNLLDIVRMEILVYAMILQLFYLKLYHHSFQLQLCCVRYIYIYFSILFLIWLKYIKRGLCIFSVEF